MKRIRGIDVSKWQGTIDWTAAAFDNVRFAMIRLGCGSAKAAPSMDSRFRENIKNALANHIPAGVYFYTYAKTPEAAVREAGWTVNQLTPYLGRISYPIALDIEDEVLSSQSKRENSAIVSAFCGVLEEAGYYAMYYTNLDFLENHLDYESLRRFDLWLAEYDTASPSDYDYGIWQYSSEGTIQGIQGFTDLNDSRRDYPAMIQKTGRNGFPRAPLKASSGPEPKPGDPAETFVSPPVPSFPAPETEPAPIKPAFIHTPAPNAPK